MITWTKIPEPKGSHDYGDTYVFSKDGVILAKVRDGGWTNAVLIIHPETQGIIEQKYHLKNGPTIDELKKQVEERFK